MQVGALGDIVFTVSDNQIKTIRDAKWSGSADIESHKIHLDNVIQEFVANDADQFSFKIRLTSAFGNDVQSDIALLFNYMRTGTTLPLTIGTKRYGKYRWLIKKLDITLEYYNKIGDLISADLSISLVEYT